MNERTPVRPIRIRDIELAFGSRTFVMGIVNVTPDSFSGDGLMRSGPADVDSAVGLAMRMVEEGADIIDIGGESTRPGHEPVSLGEERSRVIDVVAAVRMALPQTPISIDTTKAEVAEAALDAGADLINDIGVLLAETGLAAVAARRGTPYVIMHNRARPAYRDLVAEVLADLAAAVARAQGAGCARDSLIVDPGIGFGKTAGQNLLLLRELSRLRELGRPILLGTSRKSTIGRVLDLPADQRLEGTLATTALGIAAGADIVRVHDVAANVRAARVADAIIRGTWAEPEGQAVRDAGAGS